MNYDVDYFIKKFEAIPENLWTIKMYNDGELRCAFGHCGMKTGMSKYNEESDCLFDLMYKTGLTVISINDGISELYPQPTPKQRILAALYDIKAMQNPEETREDITKSLCILPPDEKSDVKVIAPISLTC